MGLLNGVRVERELEIAEGIRLITLPSSSAELPPHLAQGHMFLRDTDLLGRTLIAVDITIRPIFVNPGPLKTFDDYDNLFRLEPGWPEHREFNINDFCDALSLASNAYVRCAATWSHINPDEIFNVGGVLGGASYQPQLLHERRAVSVSEKEVREAIVLYEKRRQLGPSEARKLKVPIDRWVKSKSNQSDVDTFIDLGIALESLYLEDIRGDGEFRFRLSLRGAWYLGKDADDRERLLPVLRSLYDLRSKAVHLGEVDSDSSRELMQQGQELCLQSIVKVVRRGHFPNWNRLVLGVDEFC